MTGRRYLPGYGNTEDQYRELMNAGNNIKLTALTETLSVEKQWKRGHSEETLVNQQVTQINASGHVSMTVGNDLTMDCSGVKIGHLMLMMLLSKME